MLLFSNFVVQLLLVIGSFSSFMAFLLASSGPLQHAREAKVVLILNKSDLVQHTSPDRRPIIFEHDANAVAHRSQVAHLILRHVLRVLVVLILRIMGRSCWNSPVLDVPLISLNISPAPSPRA